MKQTQNFQLNQWEMSDRIQMGDFNADNQKIDGVLHEIRQQLAEQNAVIETCGNCKIVYGSYTGDGTYGKDNPCELTFSHKPLLLAVMPEVRLSSAAKGFLAVRGGPHTYTYPGASNSVNNVTWTDHSVSWYSADSAQYQFNSGVHHYVALLAVDE